MLRLELRKSHIKIMKLRKYLDERPRGGITEFAEKSKISPIYLCQLAAEQDDRVPSAELCVVIERESGKIVTRQELRPKDWHLIWPELIATEGAPAVPEKQVA